MKKKTTKQNKQIVEIHIYVHQVNPVGSYTPPYPINPNPNQNISPTFPTNHGVTYCTTC